MFRTALKSLLNAAVLPGLAEALESEAAAQSLRGESDEFVEGVSAFLQKRPARFGA